MDSECRNFNKEWTTKYFFTNLGSKALCLICKETVAVLKTFNIERHFETKHKLKYKSLSTLERAKKAELMISQLKKEKSAFTKQNVTSDEVTRVSYIIAHKIAKNGKPFAEGEFVKECMIESMQILCPEKTKQFEKLSLSRRTIVRRVEDIGADLQLQLKEKIKAFDYFSLALDESCDVKDTAQLLIFIRGITSDFKIVEELASMESLKDTTTGEDLLEAVNKCITKIEADWGKLVSVTTDGSPNLTGKNVGLLKRISNQV